MRIVVSTIMLNEPPEFIERWAKSALDADELVLSDTGSTNESVECARDLGVTVHEIKIRPWRFDDARNCSLALLPPCDAVVTLDVDEVLQEGWRDALETAGPADQYSYVYHWNEEVTFRGDRTHSRHGWRWKHPAHETLTWVGEGRPSYARTDMEIRHHADPDKSRGQYLPLLEMAVKEDPDDARMAHYYARELFFRGDWTRSREEFVRHLSMPSSEWPAERAQSYRYLAKMDYSPERWLLKAAGEAPNRREPWVDLALHHRDAGHPEVAAGFARRALMISTRELDYMSEKSSWDNDALQEIANGY